MSMLGTRRSSPEPRSSRVPTERSAPTSYSLLRVTRPPSISEALAVVPPHVEGDGVPDSEPPGQALSGHHPGRRTGLEGVDGSAGRIGRGHGAARRLHDQQGGVEADPFEAVRQVA